MEEKITDAKNEYAPPKGAITEHTDKINDQNIHYIALTEWLVLRKKDKPHAEMFHVAYIEKDKSANLRPITFIFNGGPGASSAYLHMGAIGPKRICFNHDGTSPKPPAKLIDNNESWLLFSDLVFIDPIGTGFSRMIDEDDLPKKQDKEKSEDHSDDKKDDKEFYKLNRDLESLGEFISKFLSKHKRWESPVFIAGESYGGFRVACLAKRLQEGFGVGLNGVIIISPALEFGPLAPTDYDLQGWTDSFPSMAAAAAFHGKSKYFKATDPIDKIATVAEEFATSKMYRFLSQGDSLPISERTEIIKEISSYMGISEDYIKDAQGRVANWIFSKKLLKDQNKLCGIYDASITSINPFPDREHELGPDPTLSGIDRIFTAGINTQLRKNLNLDSERDYHLCSMEVNTAWQDDSNQHFFMRQIGATDELRYAMALNPHMKVFITHGFYDLVTPYYTSTRLVKQMRLDPSLRKNLIIKNFLGGHMFYTWEESRKAFRDTAMKLYSIDE